MTRFIKIYLALIMCFSLFVLNGCQARQIDETNKPSSHQPADKTTLDKILERGTLRIGTTGDYLPFSYYDQKQGDELQGVDIIMGRDLAASLGVKAEFIQTSWPTLIEDLKKDKYDIGMSGITIKLDRQKYMLFSDPIYSSGKVAISRDENVEKYDTLEEINQPEVRVIYPPKGTNETFARKNFPNAVLIDNTENITIFEKIVEGKADVFVTDGIEAILHEKIHPELDAINPDSPFNTFEMGYIFNRDHTFKAYVDQWINIRLSEGKYNSLLKAEMSTIAQSAKAVSPE